VQFLFALLYSWKKSRRVRELQLKIAPRSVRDLASDIENANERTEALDEFIDFCTADQGVAGVMLEYGLTRADLLELYDRFCTMGLGQWIGGHFVALSTIAYPVPLSYVAEARRRVAVLTGSTSHAAWMTIALDLGDYWDGRIGRRGLARRLRSTERRCGARR